MIDYRDGYPLIVVELGINHQGSMDIATRMVDEIKDIVDTVGYPEQYVVIKTQKRTPHLCVPADQWDIPRVHPVTGEVVSYIDYKLSMELSESRHRSLMNLVQSYGMNYSFSVWDGPSADFGIELGLDYIKVPSAKITDMELLDFLADANKGNIIMSTGMSTGDEVRKAVQTCRPWALMATTSTYPCPDNEVNLARMDTLRDAYPGVPAIGYSNHHVSPMILVAALALGADLVEFHYTLDRAMQGSDHAASFERHGAEIVFREAKRMPEIMGDGHIAPYKSEASKIKSLRG